MPPTKEHFTCSECSKSFKYKYLLNRHVTSAHTDIRFECETCHQKFSRKDRLMRHRKVHQGDHGRMNQYKCSKTDCYATFTRKDHLVRHEMSHKSLASGDNLPSSSDPTASTSSSASREATDVDINHPSATETTSTSLLSGHLVPTTQPSIDSEDELESLIAHHWSSIVTKFTCKNVSTFHLFHICLFFYSPHTFFIAYVFFLFKVLDIFNVKLLDQQVDIRQELASMYQERVTNRIKINCSPGVIIQHKTSGKYRSAIIISNLTYTMLIVLQLIIIPIIVLLKILSFLPQQLCTL